MSDSTDNPWAPPPSAQPDADPTVTGQPAPGQAAPGQPGPGGVPPYQPYQTDPGGAPPYQPYQGPSFQPEQPKRKPLVIVAVVLGVVAVLGGAVFAATQLAGDEGSPEKAAEKLFEAVADEDLLGVMEALPPSERDAFKEPVENLADELKRLEILSEDLDLNKLSGVNVDFENLKFSKVDDIGDGLATVKIDSGRAKTSFDAKELPLGSFVRDIAGEGLSEREPETEEDDVVEEGDDTTLVALKEDGSWHISLWYSVAEGARKDAGADLPDFNQLQPKGAESPEAAVDQLLRAGAGLDVERLLQLLPPDEARALHDYAPLFLEEAKAAADEAKSYFSLDIGKLELEAKEDGDEALVRVRALEFDANLEEEGVSFSYKDGCATFTPPADDFGDDFGEPEEQTICPGDFGQGGPDLFGQFFGGIEAPDLDIAPPELGFVTVERDGEWYVSPTRTFIDNITATLKVIDIEDRDELRRFAEELGESGSFDEDSHEAFPEDEFGDDFTIPEDDFDTIPDEDFGTDSGSGSSEDPSGGN